MKASKTSFCEKSGLSNYYTLLKCNRNYRLYLLSHCMQHTGDWFIRIAALLAVERLAPGSSTAISTIVLCKTLPEVFVTPLGGILSDNFDRKKLMIALDSIAAVCTLSFIVAIRSGNVVNLFVAMALRSSIVSLYEPITKAIFPMFVTDPEDLKRTATLNGSVWAGMLLLGGVCGGYATAVIGIEICFVVDFVSYIISAMIMSNVNGTFLVTQTPINESQDNIIKYEDKKRKIDIIKSKLVSFGRGIKLFVTMTNEFIVYLLSSGFALCIFMKACGTITWGTQDVLNASFSFVEGDEGETSRRMGIIYSCAGFGCLIGPIFTNATITRGDQPHTLQLACIGAFLLLVIGWYGISNARTFEIICAFTMIRSMGESIIWMNATLLLQTLTIPEMLGRMLGFEYSIARSFEAAISFYAGYLEDEGYGKHVIASMSAMVGGFMFFLWSGYHLYGGGAANKKFRKVVEIDDKNIELQVKSHELV